MAALAAKDHGEKLSHTTSHASTTVHSQYEDEKTRGRVLEPTLSAVGNENGATVGKDVAPEPKVNENGEKYHYIEGMKFFVVFLGITLTVFLVLLDTSIIVTAIPYITSHFHSLNDVGWYGAAYLLANASLQPLTGKVYAYFSSKWAFMGFLLIFEVGSLICGIATSSTMFIIGRAIAGIGTSGLFNGGLTIVAACVPMAKRPVYTGILFGCGQTGLVLGPLLGGVLTEHATWRWCFYLNLPCGAVVSVLLFMIAIPDRRIPTTAPWYKTIYHQFDLIGFFFFALAVVQLLLAVEWGGVRYDWSSSQIIGLFCGFGATFAVFLYWEYRVGEKAMLPFSMIGSPVVLSSCLVMALFFGNMLTTTYYLPIYFQTIRGTSPTLSGVYLLPTVIPMMISAVLSGIMITKVLKYIPPYVIFGGMLAAISSGLLSMLDLHSSTGKWIGYQIIGGFGRGLSMQMGIVAVQNYVSPTKIPIGTALIIFSQTLGGALFLSLDQTLFSAELKKALKVFAPELDAQQVIDAGAFAVRDLIGEADIQNVLKAFNRAIDRVFYLATGAAVAYLIIGCGMGWKKLNGQKEKGEDPAEA